MDEEEKVLMDKFGVTCETKIVYRYKQHQYNNLKDALNFAQLDTQADNDDSKMASNND